MRSYPQMWLLLWALSGCTSILPDEHNIPDFDPELVSGEALFGEPVSVTESPEYDILYTSPAMYAFVGDIGNGRVAVKRFRQLLDRLRRSGFFESHYDTTVTNTAAATFESKIGNCISYTNLFVALARAAGLNVHYQIVKMEHPTWNAESGLLIRNNHINVVVEGTRFDRNRSTGHTVDFNLVDPDPQAHSIKVTDRFAESLFYANLSVDAIRGGNDRLAFAFLLRAIESESRNPDVWINLGAFYGRKQAYALAVEAYTVAQRLLPRDKMILSGLERSYRSLGEIDKADALLVKVKRYRQRNPFYHFAVARTAYEQENYQQSLVAIDRAIRLKRRNPRFYYIKSLAEQQVGDEEAAHRSLRLAQRYGRFDDLQRRYGSITP